MESSTPWMRLVAVYNELVGIACEAIREHESPEIVNASILALSEVAFAWVNGRGMDLDELKQIYDLRPWQSHHGAGFAVLELIESTAPTNVESFETIYQIAKFAEEQEDEDLLVVASETAVRFLSNTTRDEMGHGRYILLAEFDRLIEQWERDPELGETAKKIREVYK